MADDKKFGKITDCQDETALLKVLEKMETHKFPVSKKIAEGQNVYDLKYYENKLQHLEGLNEGEITFNGRIKILRKYCVPKTADNSMYDFYTRVEDTSIEKKSGVFLLVHGFAQCSDVWMETQIQLAMNGFVVFAIDLEGYGYSSGTRVTAGNINKFHHQVSTLIQLASTIPDLPAFMMGHSMGCLAINTYLQNNPEYAAKLAGVVYGAPFFGMAKKKSGFQKWIVRQLGQSSDELTLAAEIPVHKICRNKQFVRMTTTSRKSHNLLTPGFVTSLCDHHDLVQKNANQVNYPYQLILGEKDVLVDNASSRKWNDATKSSVKNIKVLTGSFHELSKEPNSKDYFETILKFAAQQAPAGTKGFGDYDPKKVKIVSTTTSGKSMKLHSLVAAVVVIGAVSFAVQKFFF